MSLIVMDWMSDLAKEAVASADGHERDQARVQLDTDYAQVVCRGYRTLMMGRRSEMGQEDLDLLLGCVNAYLFSLDARNAAVLEQEPIFLDIDLVPLFPHTAQASANPLVNYSTLSGDFIQELGQGLLPLVYATALLYRKYLAVSAPDKLRLLWDQIDLSLSSLAFTLSSSLPVSSEPEQTKLKYDLDGLVHTEQLSLLQLDLLIHQKIVQAFVSLSSQQPQVPIPPELLDSYNTSRLRVQEAFQLVTGLAQEAIGTFSWRRARAVAESLWVCSAWTSLGDGTSKDTALMTELGITLDMGQTLEQCLALAAWTSSSAAKQRERFLKALTTVFGQVPRCSLPEPPPPPPPPPFDPIPAWRKKYIARTLPISAATVEENYANDFSFLDDFAREHGIPMDGQPVTFDRPGQPSTGSLFENGASAFVPDFTTYQAAPAFEAPTSSISTQTDTSASTPLEPLNELHGLDSQSAFVPFDLPIPDPTDHLYFPTDGTWPQGSSANLETMETDLLSLPIAESLEFDNPYGSS
ncbi:uncharacterized protein JCM15063_001603 [Sporobolomyces koalae]|uniref:uncharacterized protein n=1 Tax=Sporobolomyces koalae TaxID=500713 RepID=UPI0031791BD2